jgi:acyl-CoA thioesterase-1
LEQLVERMQHTGATLIWASTTPIPDVPDKQYSAASIVERNHLAAEIMNKHHVLTDDLFSAVSPRLMDFQNPNDVHFNAKGYDFLGQQVAASIESTLKTIKSKR